MTGYVYFILCEPMAAVKIGYTAKNPHARLSALQTGCPAPLKLSSFVAASMDEERQLHQSFAPLHIQGEWFRLEGKLQDFVWYMIPPEGVNACRGTFEGALHDVLMQGTWYPNGDLDHDEYYATADWEPFRALLWDLYGPWEE